MAYQQIKQQHSEIAKDINKYQSTSNQQTKAKNSITFLIKCRQHDLIPNFINNALKNVTDTLNHDNQNLPPKLIKEKQNFIEKTKRCILNFTIEGHHYNLKKYRSEGIKIKQNINQHLNIEEASRLWDSELTRAKKYEEKTKQRHIKKFEQLKSQHTNNMRIVYNEAWFCNLTNIEIPTNTKLLLSLGPKHALPYTQKEIPVFKLIADSEECIQTIKEKEEQEIARAKVTSILDNEMNKQQWDKTEKFMARTVEQTQRFLKKNKNILILEADKGNVTVAMEKEVYDIKIQNIINDMMAYRRLQKDPTTTLHKKTCEIIDKMASQGIITEREKSRMKSTVPMAPRIYGLPKIHKENTPLRPICSNINAPAHDLCKHLTSTLKILTEGSVYNVKNATEFKERLNNTTISDDEVMISFDVVSLFPSVPVDHALKLIDNNWHKIEESTKWTKEFFLKTLAFCIKDTRYFKYKDKLYKQLKGLPMGSPASPIVADIVMEDLLDKCMQNLPVKPKLLTKYVDDIFAIVKKDQVENTLRELNNYHKNIKFTKEEEDNNELPYLDAKLIRINNKIKVNWYQKPTSSGRLINYFSKHPKHIITNTAYNFIKRVLTISDDLFQEDNRRKITKILTMNSFPEHVINHLLRRFKGEENKNKTDPEQPKIFKSITYVPKIAERMSKANFYDEDSIKIAYKMDNTVKKLFSNTKSKINKMEKNNVIYRIKCNGNEQEECGMMYVGTTKNTLKTRISGHKSNIKSRNTDNCQQTALSSHCAKNHHAADFDHVDILQAENAYNKRLTLEMLHIINTPKNQRINYKADTENLALSYRHLVYKRKRQFAS